MNDVTNWYRKVVEALKLLSLPYEDQKKYFENFVDIPFEVIDTFDNSFLLLPQLIEGDKFSLLAVASLIRLHNMINFATKNPHLKDLSEDQFSSAQEWNQIRELSKQTLLLIGESIEKPDSNYI